MSTTPDFCCDTKCITIKKCDGPWCLGSVREQAIDAPDCKRATKPGHCCLGEEGALHGSKLRVGSNAACCGTLRRCDTLEIVDAAGAVTATLTIRAIRNGVIIARDDVTEEGYRLEGYKGHLVHVRKFPDAPDANDGLRSREEARYHTYKACANGDCSSVPTCSSDDGPCGCPC